MKTYTAFLNSKRVAQGELPEVALKLKKQLRPGEMALVFDDLTGGQVDINLRGSADAVTKRLQPAIEPAKPAGPGRPRLGVVSREISLLPRHWDWLALQPGGASVTLRKLVEDAKKKNSSADRERMAREATHKFLSAIAGDLPHFEEALRALYARKEDLFETLLQSWPKDIRQHALAMAEDGW